MDADVFSQPIGYVPQFPSPPKYIKVRSHGKKEKDFNRVFLAQELRGKSGVEIAQNGGRLVKNSALRPRERDGNAIWAMEFSKDGKYLAAGGKDFIVRVWQVISTKEERSAHETEEEGSGKGGERVRLSAPVFRPTTIREYEGHEASILDLNWSKVGALKHYGFHNLTHSRTIFYFRRRWTRPYDSGTSAGNNACATSSIAISSRLSDFIPAMTAFFWPDPSTPSR